MRVCEPRRVSGDPDDAHPALDRFLSPALVHGAARLPVVRVFEFVFMRFVALRSGKREFEFCGGLVDVDFVGYCLAVAGDFDTVYVGADVFEGESPRAALSDRQGIPVQRRKAAFAAGV